jgi:hypothetical protein
VRHHGVFIAGALVLAGAGLLVRRLAHPPGPSPRSRSRSIDGDKRPLARPPSREPSAVPVWLKIGYAVATPIIAGVYWRAYGPKNFLWLSDLALASTTLSVIGENRLLASLPAVGTLPLEAAWTIDFLSSGRALGLTGYMFDRQYPLGLRALSLFHVALPPTLIWMLARLGYDRRAFRYQTVLVWCVLPLTYALTEPEKNVNWVFGPGSRPQRRLPPLLYLALEMVVMPVLAILPTHIVLERAFGSGPSDARSVIRGGVAEPERPHRVLTLTVERNPVRRAHVRTDP